jgi:hypothetical protein
MKIQKYKILYEKKDKIQTAILYSIASSKASNEEFMIFEYKSDDVGIILNRCLKALKMDGKIDFYIRAADIRSSTEGSYLINKHPSLVDGVADSDAIFIVKL